MGHALIQLNTIMPLASSGTNPRLRQLRLEINSSVNGGVFVGRYLLLWLLGMPLPILVLIYAFGGLH